MTKEKMIKGFLLSAKRLHFLDIKLDAFWCIFFQFKTPFPLASDHLISVNDFSL
jgi:hypothetical protein